jgi:hypothetical protein
MKLHFDLKRKCFDHASEQISNELSVSKHQLMVERQNDKKMAMQAEAPKLTQNRFSFMQIQAGVAAQ